MKFVHTADTHLGFEITKIFQGHPRGRKKRADSIFKNFLTVIQHALDNKVDLFIHSGDLFNKYYIRFVTNSGYMRIPYNPKNEMDF